MSSDRVHGWFEDRMGIDAIWRVVFLRKIPYGVNLFYTLGFAAITLFLIQATTGIVLAMYYSPSPDHAYDSIQFIMTELPFGEVIRSIHHAGASAMVVVVVLHMLAVFVMASYKYPRETTWVLGVGLLAITLGFGFTGYLLPWDEKAYWATTVGTNIAGTIPVIGGILVRIVRGGAGLGALTLTRFYAAHVLLLPAAIIAFIAAHLFLVVRQGVSVPPGLWDRELRSASKASAANNVTEYHTLYERFKALGRPFFPDLIFEDAAVSVLVTLIVVGLAVLIGAPLESQADPTDTSYVPRPEWYFMFLFEMLKYFPGSIEWIGAMILPGLFLLVLVLLPFFDRRPWRTPRSRPIAMLVGLVVVIGIAFLTGRAYQTTPSPAGIVVQREENLNEAQLTGRQLIQEQNCRACHTIAGKGGQVGPKLDGIGSRRDAAYIHAYIENPKNLNPSANMPAFIPPLTHEQVEDITQYLLTLK